jgi:glycosyltransferase involved in cell wall biosynthesis
MKPVAHNPIRVAHVITRLILGGAQENTLYTAIGQHRDPRFEVTLICGIDEAGEGDLFAQAETAGLKVVIIPSLVRPIRPAADIRALVALTRLLRRGKFDVVHTHSSKAGILGRLAARLARVPVVIHTLHSLVFHEYQSSWTNAVYIGLKRLCAPLTDRLISVSNPTTQGALSMGIGRSNQYVTIFSGMQLERFLGAQAALSVRDAKSKAGLDPDAPVVGKIARFFPLKGHEQFLAAAVQISQKEPRVQFLLVGDGPLREEFERQAALAGLRRRMVFSGRVPPEEVPAWIQAMDVVVHTSLREGIARVLPQAGAVGKPVVTFALDGAPEVIRDGISGFLVPPLDTAALAEKVLQLLGDPDACRVLGAAGKAFAAKHFALEKMIEQINAVYFAELSARGLLAESSVSAGAPEASSEMSRAG